MTKLSATWSFSSGRPYHYCEIDAATVQGLQAARSKRQFFETRIRGSGADGPFDCRMHPIPKKYRQ
ncbi:KTSC domain-containing protein [Variovorax sp. Sphag1AA]|uniref:KTSC domain-containing protein n=1 Tax=Variovorax sp. Sphag1AA TaxID=2587027 RepID=UPI0021A7DFB5|nr:KTSC domain-containing protein [Variovorax sp. Sphag1AA]